MALMIALFVTPSANALGWKLSKNFWSDEDEKAYEKFVEKLGGSKHSNLNKFIRDPKTNPLYGEEDKKIRLYADCADLPYLIRAYVAYKLRLPFSYVSSISGKGGDQRYSNGNKPVDFKDQDYFSSPQNLFSKVTLVNSGFYRMGPEVEDSDHYPVKIQKESIKPGTIYYDPDGHVAIVSKVTTDGRIRVIDAHPDRTISKPWFGAKFTRGTSKNGGGFKRWRPIRYTSDGQIRRTRNHNTSDYSATEQFQKVYTHNGRKGLSFYEYVRTKLAVDSNRLDPVNDFRFMISDLYEDICYRAVAVDLCMKKGIHRKPHPGSLPWNIYGTDGVWEEFSTPSRDARLKVAFRDLYDRTRQIVLSTYQQSPPEAFKLAGKLLEQYELLSQKFSIHYTDSSAKIWILTFDEITNRLFRLSFDPYHSIEYRWGGGVAELAASADNQTKKRFYELEWRLRNQIERIYNQPTPLSMGPEKSPEVSVKKWLLAFLNGQQLPGDSYVATSVKQAEKYAVGMSPAEIQVKKEIKAAEEKALLTAVSTEDDHKNDDSKVENSKAEPALKVVSAAQMNLQKPGFREFTSDLFNVCDDFAFTLTNTAAATIDENQK